MLNDETFAILVLMALFTTFITTPTVMAIYKPARSTHRKLKDLSASEDSPKEELRILACLHGPANVSSLISVIESIRTTKVTFLYICLCLQSIFKSMHGLISDAYIRMLYMLHVRFIC